MVRELGDGVGADVVPEAGVEPQAASARETTASSAAEMARRCMLR